MAKKSLSNNTRTNLCPNTDFFWCLFSRTRTEYGEILRISPYSVQMRENTDQKKLRVWKHFTQ